MYRNVPFSSLSSSTVDTLISCSQEFQTSALAICTSFTSEHFAWFYMHNMGSAQRNLTQQPS